MATKAQKAGAGTATCWLLCAGYVAGTFYEAGVVLEGVPDDVLASHAGMLDADAGAVAAARAAGWPAVAYKAD